MGAAAPHELVVVRGHHHAAPLAAGPLERTGDLLHADGVEAARRFVQHEHGPLAHEPAGYGEALPLPARERHRMPLAQPPEAQLAQEAPCPLPVRLVMRDQEHDFLLDARREELGLDVVGAVPHHAAQLAPPAGAPAHQHRPVAWLREAGEDAGEAGLPDAVRARHRHYLPGAGHERDAAEDLPAAKGDAQAPQLEDGILPQARARGRKLRPHGLPDVPEPP